MKIGLITHKKSKYLNSNGRIDEFENLASITPPEFDLMIVDKDEYEYNQIEEYNDPELIKFILASQKNLNLYYLKKMLKIKSRNDKIKNVRFLFEFNLSLLMSMFKIMIRKRHSVIVNILRQENITASHIDLLIKANKSPKSSILILEDDFQIEFINKDKKKIFEILIKIFEQKNWAVVNLSKSFNRNQLAIASIGQKIELKIDHFNQNIYEYKFPAVNTACALYYDQDIITELIFELQSLNSAKMIPIDHKINIALESIFRRNKEYRYVSFEPGIIIQKSIHSK